MWYTHHLSLHSLRKFHDLCHGHFVCQSNKVCMDVLECVLHIHTYDIITSPLLMVSREAIWPSSSNICVYMTSINICHHTKTCLFYFTILKNTKKLIIQKEDRVRIVTYVSVCGSQWNGNIRVAMEVYPLIGVVIYGYDIPAPLEEEVCWVGVVHSSPC